VVWSRVTEREKIGIESGEEERGKTMAPEEMEKERSRTK